MRLSGSTSSYRQDNRITFNYYIEEFLSKERFGMEEIMKSTYVRVKGIIKKGDTYLLLKRWVDDRIPDPFVWEFIDAEVPHGEADRKSTRLNSSHS